MRRLLWAIPAIGLLVMAYRWYALTLVPIDHWAGFGATVAQCAAAFRPAALTTTDRKLVSPRTRCYVKGGWSVLVGFDERDHAEQFVISRVALLTTPPDLSAPEQTRLLAAFSDGSRWLYQSDNGGVGPMWEREDGQGYASYITGAHYMVLMNKAGLDRQVTSLNEEAEVRRGQAGSTP